jgi:Iron/manganese superoxide dismutases, alpha-hairpin domain
MDKRYTLPDLLYDYAALEPHCSAGEELSLFSIASVEKI